MDSKAEGILRLHPGDHVAIALQDLAAGTALDPAGLRCRQAVPRGHKVALCALPAGARVLKYGQIIGFAARPIAAGDWVHTHNLGMKAFDRAQDIGADARSTTPLPPEQRATFQGILRADGRVATRNYLGVIATVNCAATVGHRIAAAFTDQELAAYPQVDGVVALTHGTGCAMVMGGEGYRVLQRTLTGYARHPNFAGVLLLGLGCETVQIEALLGELQPDDARLHHLVIQDQGGTSETVRQGVTAVRAMLPAADRITRQPVPADKLLLALECGGSDAYSGITANPALGRAVDLLVEHGGTAILSETPEIYGAEHLLARRAVNRAVGEKLEARIRWWEEYTRRLGGEIDNNPSPGNKAGGLTTILEKSLGAVAKGGTTALKAVLEYAEPVTTPGLVFMDTPGYDPASVTGMVAGGANLIAFTTGRGTVCGFKPVPSLKLASNTVVYERMRDDMDIDCGPIIDRDRTVAQTGEEIFRRILEVASGRKTRSEQLGFGDLEFVPWQLGPVL